MYMYLSLYLSLSLSICIYTCTNYIHTCMLHLYDIIFARIAASRESPRVADGSPAWCPRGLLLL